VRRLDKDIKAGERAERRIRDYFKQPRWAALTKKQEEKHGRDRRQSI